MKNIKFKQFLIYQIKNLINQKLYVGQTSQSISCRWSQHLFNSKTPKYPIHFAIAKYGSENFEISVLEICFDSNSANESEIKWIAQLNTTDKNFGYNLSNGGDVKITSPETKKKLSDKRKQLHIDKPEILINFHSEENRKKAGQSLSKTLTEHPEITQQLIEAAHTPEANAKRGKAKSDYFKNNPEALARLIESAHNLSPEKEAERIEKMKKSLTGRKLSEEHKRKLKEHAINNPLIHSDEAKEKIAASKRGKPRSEETKAKIKATKLLRKLEQIERIKLSAPEY